MVTLASLQDTCRYRKKVQRKGRGPGSGRGKTCGRGEKGAGSRSGWKSRLGYEGGQFRLYCKVPIRGFNQNQFRKPYDTVNLEQLDFMFNDGDVVDLQALYDKGFLNGVTYGLKILGKGELKKKVTIHADAISESAREKLTHAKIAFTVANDDDTTEE